MLSCSKPYKSPLADKQLELPEIKEFCIYSKYLDSRQPFVLIIPREAKKRNKLPALILMSGRGEAIRSPIEGARAWTKYYGIQNIYAQMRDQKLPQKIFLNNVKEKHYNAYSTLLKKYPFKEFFIISPKTPDIDRENYDFDRFEKFLRLELIPFLSEKYKIDESKIGINGISLGGLWSLYLGTSHPEFYRFIGNQQGAFKKHSQKIERNLVANREELKKSNIRLVTSERDYLKQDVIEMKDILKKHGLKHSFVILDGPHDYIFNQGAGSVDILFYFYISCFYPEVQDSLPQD